MKTRRVAVKLFGTMAGRTAWLVVAAGLLLLGASVLLQAGKQHRQFTDMRQQQLRQVAQQASQTLRARIGSVGSRAGNAQPVATSTGPHRCVPSSSSALPRCSDCTRRSAWSRAPRD